MGRNTVLTAVPGALVALLMLFGSSWAGEQTPGLDAETLFNNGLGHLRDGRNEQAVEAIKQAIKQDGKNAYFYKGLGQAYLRLSKYDEAISAFRKSLELNKYYVDVHNDLGTALMLAGKRAEGRKEFLAAFNDPTNPAPEVTARNIGQAYFDEKNYGEALNWFRTSIDRNRHYPEAHVRAADTLVVTGKVDEAVSVLENASNALPDDASVTLALGEAYYRAGRFNDAKARLEEVSKKDPVGPLGKRARDLLSRFPK